MRGELVARMALAMIRALGVGTVTVRANMTVSRALVDVDARLVIVRRQLKANFALE